MTSRRIFSWSKRQSGGSEYYRTGGIVSIDSPHLVNNGAEAKVAPKTARKVPSELKIITTENKPFLLSPLSASYMVNAASTLQAALNDILRSPAPCSATDLRPASVHKPLPGRPRSISLPTIADLPAELPGSILQENQGFPSDVVLETTSIGCPNYQNIRRSTLSVLSDFEDAEEFSALLKLFPEPLHDTNVPSFTPRSEMRSAHSEKALSPSLMSQPKPLRIQHNRSVSETTSHRRSRSELVASSVSTDVSLPESGRGTNPFARTRVGTGKTLQPSPFILEGQTWDNEQQERRRSELEPASTPTPSTTRSKQLEELQRTVATQHNYTSTFQTQSANLGASHESYIESLTDSHSSEVTSLKNNVRALEEQLARQPSLRHASSNNLLFLIDTTETQAHGSESAPQAAEIGAASPNESFQTAYEEQQRPTHRVTNSPDMENLKRKLSSTRRPETASRNLLPELNQYKQNNVALQKQIESLMAKLNESRSSERVLKVSLDEMSKSRDEWEEKAGEARKAAKNVQALQNTIDHLEDRLEIANMERLDAQEQLFIIQAQKSPFDFRHPSLDLPPATDHEQDKTAQGPHMSTSTIFSSGSPISPEKESQELSTLATFVAHIERLQDQVRQKDAEVQDLERSREELQQSHDQIEREQRALNLQVEIQNQLLKKTRRTDEHIEQLRAAILDREAIISEKDRSVRALERQLEYHKLLLQAQIRRHATMTLHAATSDNPLPELSKLTKREDIDRWIEQLQERLKKEKLMAIEHRTLDPIEARVADLRQEIDFYVREIIYYKLDIRGYKGDIRKLKKVTAQLSSFASRASDLDSDTSSLRPAATPAPTPELTSSDPRATSRPSYKAHPISRPITPPPSEPVSASKSSYGGSEVKSTGKRVPSHRDLQTPKTPQTPTRKVDRGNTGRADPIDFGVSLGQMNPTSPTRLRIKFGELLTSFPLGAAATPQKHKRSMSESTVPSYPAAGLPVQLSRSASLSESNRGRVTPDRPPRPQNSLFESPRFRRTAIFRPSHSQADGPTEAPISPLPATAAQASLSRRNSNASTVRIAPPHTALETQDGIARSPSPSSHAALRPRAGSASSAMAITPEPVGTSQERKLSAALNSSIPFVIGIGSPHNPAFVAPAITMQPTPCSITRNAPLKINPATSRVGVGGTMASSTSVSSPISPTDTSMLEPSFSLASTKPVPVPQTRKLSFSRKREDAPPKTPPHSRNVSGGSNRTAIRLPRTRERDVEARKMRKDSIGMPQPFGDPFGFERSMSVDEGNRGEAEVYGVGEAI
ncbi:hypothetical protein HBH56_204410 [Parastagonospora nodorum]|uniref:Uncharacterized protein n=1 Tax=Phaeosphaeria nodorum (strain SN15 / ATCC MYA-4574 / FGSC 10173) TaxID=321614 RepID=A0A7U2I6I2_PHANO|nr:hypothetical protein HBH56_204410 [Parastagonospora nodorum]QRD01672.1 hypothetical protein JI435_145820 [Parastagonospora nodorum SN15]KAH3923936.1 hypothetical protein HBH54_203290 [Parastagonospora nodorum]KAH4013792.1 hypothetical protein HBI09_213970 [Parastagonospora nodorum]KAH4114413.1 hypothetical protein HBH47_197050 [Parastagonospora nodorum]